MAEAGRFYRVQAEGYGTHFALRWKGRVRYTVPQQSAGRTACWQVFRPGMLGIPLRGMVQLPRLFGAVSCAEGPQIGLIRAALDGHAGLSCCRTGAAGPWSKDTILLLDKKTAEPLYFVKAGSGSAVDSLLRNEAAWLRTLGEDKTIAPHVPALIAERSGEDFCYLAQGPLSGDLDFCLRTPQLDFLRKLQTATLRIVQYEDSELHANLSSRLADLEGSLTAVWSARINQAMRRIKESLSGTAALFVAAHNDFTPWNIRVQRNLACVFDWEYASSEQLPLFDPLHFALMPMALKRRPTIKMVQQIKETIQLCENGLAGELCYEAQTQALAYLMNVCTLYLWGARREPGFHPVLESYAGVIDQMCQI